MQNSLQGLADGVSQWGLTGNMLAPQNSRLDTIFINTRWSLISNFRSILSEAYAEYGIVQTLVEQPVSDAFSTGFDIITDDLDDSEKRRLLNYVEKNRIIEIIKEACNWARLYGGGGVLVMTDQNPSTPFEIDRLGKNLEFRACDMWELYNSVPMWNPWEEQGDKYYNYYGVRLHPSRVLPVCGKKAPSFLRNRLRGWGMSELERVVRSINSYLKNQDLIFELLDEAKLDVYQLNGFNTAMLTAQGTKTAERRVQVANTLKSYLNALILDVNDKYEQKQMSFNGLSEILNQIRQGVAADLKMPMTKLFGVSAAGFNSGEDDIENYNAMIESEIRSKVKFIVIQVLEICCEYLFGKVPQDLSIEFKSLRVLSAEQEENMKTSQFNRLIQAVANGLATPEQFMAGCNRNALLPITFTQEDMAAANENIDLLSEDVAATEEKKPEGFLSWFKGKKDPIKASDGERASDTGTVIERDVTSNKFVVPDREKRALPDKSFPYKGKRTGRFIRVSQ